MLTGRPFRLDLESEKALGARQDPPQRENTP